MIISGSVSTHVVEPRKGRLGAAVEISGGKIRKKLPGADAYAGMKPNDTLNAGHTIGEGELLTEDPTFPMTAITNDPVEIMEIERADFDRILRADRSSAMGHSTVTRTKPNTPASLLAEGAAEKTLTQIRLSLSLSVCVCAVSHLLLILPLIHRWHCHCRSS